MNGEIKFIYLLSLGGVKEALADFTKEFGLSLSKLNIGNDTKLCELGACSFYKEFILTKTTRSNEEK